MSDDEIDLKKVEKDDGKSLDPAEIWVFRSAYLRFTKSDWRDPKAVKKFLTSSELKVLSDSGTVEDLDKVIKYFSKLDLNKNSISKLYKYFKEDVFSEKKPD